MKISFLGAVQTVTGSKYLIESKSTARILIDCGLFQGLKHLRLKNWETFPVDPKSISAIVLTHAHIDHSGYIPRLVKEGFEGKIFCTSPTKALAEILLRDSARLKEEEAEYANRKNYSKHSPALALYTEEDVERSLPLFETKNLKEEFWINDLRIRFSDAGHILGAASVKVIEGDKSIFFSGDLGRFEDPITYPPHAPLDADYCVMESTYGDRLHRKENPENILKDLLEKIYERKSVLLIPSFALGRAQLLMYYFSKIFETNPHLRVPLYLNSPMALEITRLYLRFADQHKLESMQFKKIMDEVKFIHSVEESKALNLQSGPMIIIASSGMLTGGRILHHLDAFGGDPNNILMLAGFQSAGTRGSALSHGEKVIKYFGYYHEIEAEIVNPNVFSAHADQVELINWLKLASKMPNKVLLTHGEPEAADVLRRKIKDEVKIEAVVVTEGMQLEL